MKFGEVSARKELERIYKENPHLCIKNSKYKMIYEHQYYGNKKGAKLLPEYYIPSQILLDEIKDFIIEKLTNGMSVEYYVLPNGRKNIKATFDLYLTSSFYPDLEDSWVIEEYKQQNNNEPD